MPAKNPEEICRLFNEYMAQGDVESLLSIYDPEAAFLDQAGEVKRGRPGMREVLTPLAAAKTAFDYNIKQIIQSGDIALMHTEWKAPSLSKDPMYAIEVARRQPDGGWCWLIGDPFTVGKHACTSRRPTPS
jgi:ketosteroid isomerase-like protein